MLRKLALAYLAIGCILSSIMLFSYAWGGWGIALFHPGVWVSTVLRTVLWGPSLVAWYAEPRGYSFGRWLAPGFYTEVAD
jgi:hypothetical protein